MAAKIKTIFIALVLAMAVAGGWKYINAWLGLGDDNKIEEVAEDVLYHQTGINVDFTPDSIEQ